MSGAPTSDGRVKELLEEIAARTFGSDVIRRMALEALQALKGVTGNETRAELEPTREHLQKMVQRTAGHWLSLQITHPIPWEGGLDAAMEAACNEIRRLDPNAQKANEQP